MGRPLSVGRWQAIVELSNSIAHESGSSLIPFVSKTRLNESTDGDTQKLSTTKARHSSRPHCF